MHRKIDAHPHFWKYDPVRDAWITDEMQHIRKDFLPDQLSALLDQNGFEGSVAVQADQSIEETRFLLDLARQNNSVMGVVGWFDLRASQLEDQLEEFAGNKSLKGARHIVQGEEKGFLLQPDFVRGVTHLGQKGLAYDILTYEHQLDDVLAFVKVIPEMRLVIDHISKPDIANRSFDAWAHHMSRLSEFPHVHVKLSGLITEANWHQWSVHDLEPYIDHCLNCFGVEHLMFGSDWPVCLVAGTYGEVVNAVEQCISSLSSDEQEFIMGKTATTFYQLSTSHESRT